MNKKVYIVLPAYNEASVIKGVINSVKNAGFKNIIVVDDGSSDNTFQESLATGVIVLRHLLNRGKGAATQTGLDAAKLLHADFIVTIDADGQHDPNEIKKLLEPLQAGTADVVIGSRMLNTVGMPISRILMNKVGNWITYLFFGIKVSDSQSGFRAYSYNAINSVYTYLDGYEFESEMLGEIRKAKLRIKEIPIKVVYTDYSMNKYKSSKTNTSQGLVNGIKMVKNFIENTLFK